MHKKDEIKTETVLKIYKTPRTFSGYFQYAELPAQESQRPVVEVERALVYQDRVVVLLRKFHVLAFRLEVGENENGPDAVPAVVGNEVGLFLHGSLTV